MISILSSLLVATDANKMAQETAMHGSWFGVGDGTVVMWSLVWVLLPISVFVIFGLLWSIKAGQFQDVDDIAKRQLDLED